MKGFANGVGGVCICMLAIMGTIMCGYFLGVEETVTTRTEYSLTADTTGLFDTQESKRYIDYNPAANWTGFRETGSTEDVTGGISYDYSSKVNTYPVAQADQYLTSKQYNLRTSTIAQADPPGVADKNGLSGLLVSQGWADNITALESYIVNPRVATVADFIALFQPTLTGVYADWSELVVQFQESGTTTSYGACAPITDWTERWFAWSETGTHQKIQQLDYDTLMECYYIKISTDLTVRGYDADGAQIWQTTAGNAGIVFWQYEKTDDYPASSSQGDVKSLAALLKIGIYGESPNKYMDVSKGVRVAYKASGLATTEWSNGYQNGKIDVLCTWNPGYDVNDLYLNIPVNFTESTYATGYLKTLDLSIMLRYYLKTTGNVYSISLYTSVDNQQQSKEGAGDYSKGALLSLDFMNDRLEVYGLSSFRTFQDYTVMDTPGITLESYFSTLADFDTQVTPGTISAEKIQFGAWTSHTGDVVTDPNFGVVDTSVYMGDTALMMNNPSINPVNFWPGNEQWEMRFYSFAIEGESLWISGQNGKIATYPVESGKLIVDGKEHTLTDVRIRASWTTYGDDTSNAWHVWILFGSENPAKEIYVGNAGSDWSKDGPIIRWNGFWYFTSAYYTGTQVASTDYTLDFQHFIFDSNAAILCYMGLLIMGTIVLKRMSGLGVYDMIVLVFAGVCGFVLMV